MSLSKRLKLRNWLRRVPMPLLAILIGGAVGLVVWVALDRFQTQAVRDMFHQDMEGRLDRWAVANLIAFNSYVDSYTSVTRLLASHRRMATYLEPINWFEGDETPPKIYDERPPVWVPPASRWQSVVHPSHLLLIDTGGRTREIYRMRDLPLPQDLVQVDRVFLNESLVQAFMTAFEGRPYLIVSDPVEDYSGTVMAVLTMVVPIDDSFLRATQRGYAGSETVIAVLSEDLREVLASSDPATLPDGTDMDRARERFVVTTQSFFDYQGSYLNMQFGIFVPRSRIAEMTNQVLDHERRQRIILALVFVSAFTLVIMLVSEHLSRVLHRITRFSGRALGFGHQPVSARGNQLILLEDWIKNFIRMVLSAREEMRRRHESEMRDTEALKSAVMEASLDSVITIEGSGRVIEFNPTAEQTFGFSREETIGRSISELLIDEASRRRFHEILDTCLVDTGDGSADVRSEMVATRSDGARFPIEVAIKPILLESQLVFTVYLHDISDRKRAEQEIQSLARFTSESPSPVLRVNRPGVLLYANAASDPLLKYWGVRRGQTLPPYWKNLITGALSSGETAEHELVSDTRIYSLLLAPMGELEYVNIYGRDITEVRMAEQETRQHQADLVHVCRLSTMGEMATGLAHELNQPLSAIVNFANGCSRRMRLGIGGQDELIEALGQISAQADRAGEIIRRLRNLVGKQPPVREQVDVNQLAREVCSFVEFETRRMRLKCEEDLFPEPLTIRADLVQIEQVLLNLVRNALDAVIEVPEERRRLSLSTRPLGHDKVQIVVEDTGPGIDRATLHRLFDPFFSTKETGMGMGLAISQTIIADHQGKITVDSEPGVGTVFRVTLPLYAAAYGTDQEPRYLSR